MSAPARLAMLALCPLAVVVLLAACADSAGGPTLPDPQPLFASGSGSDGDGGGGDDDEDNSGSGTGDGTAPTTGTGQVQIVRGGLGSGTITSQPAGISCAIGFDGPAGAC